MDLIAKEQSLPQPHPQVTSLTPTPNHLVLLNGIAMLKNCVSQKCELYMWFPVVCACVVRAISESGESEALIN